MFLFFPLTAFGLNIGTDKDSYALGEQIQVFGECAAPVEISVTAGQKFLFSRLFACENENFKATVSTEPSFPSGSWQVSAKSKGVASLKEVKFSPTRESRLLDIKILSPSRDPRSRASGFVLNVEVSFLGEKIGNASVYSWNPLGEKTALTPKGNGVYETRIEVPFDYTIGDWVLTVTAQYEGSEGIVGGEKTLVLPIIPAVINAEVVKPKSWIFVTNVAEEIIIKPSYSDGSPVREPEVSAFINGKHLAFETLGNNAFRSVFSFSAGQGGAHTLDLNIKDPAGNTYSKKIDLFVEKSILSSLLPVNDLPLYAAALVSAIAVALLLYFWRKLGKIKGSAGERQRILEEIKKLQSDYYIKKSIAKDFYDSEIKRLELRLAGIEKKLKRK